MTGAAEALHRYWLGLGTNLGDRPANLAAAVAALRDAGVTVEAASPVYETAPREIEDQPAFLNAALRVAAPLSPPGMLRVAKAVERGMGRDPAGLRYGPRPIDCDLLLWGGGVWDEPELRVPHPRLTERRFAMVPLLALDPGLVLPDGRALAEACAAIDPAAQPVRRWGPGGLV